MKNKGFTVVEILLIFVAAILLVLLGLYIYDLASTEDSSNEQEVLKEQKGEDFKKAGDGNPNVQDFLNQNQAELSELHNETQGWVQKKLDNIGMKFSAPPEWSDESQQDRFGGGDFDYEEVTLVSPDGFRLSVYASNIGRGVGNLEDTLVLESEPIESPNDSKLSYVIDERSDSTVGTIVVMPFVEVGSQEVVLGRVSTGILGDNQTEIELEINGYFSDEDGAPNRRFKTLDEFNEQKSVIQAKEILKSIIFE